MEGNLSLKINAMSCATTCTKMLGSVRSPAVVQGMLLELLYISKVWLYGNSSNVLTDF